MYRAAVITVSTRAAAGVYADDSGPAIVRRLEEAGFDVRREPLVVSDDQDAISRAVAEACADVDVVITNGGTGIHPRDVTPEATLDVVERTVPGIAEAMRAASLAVTPMAMLSRGVAGVRSGALVINLPGSPKGALENLEAVIDVLRHAVDQLHAGDHPRA